MKKNDVICIMIAIVILASLIVLAFVMNNKKPSKGDEEVSVSIKLGLYEEELIDDNELMLTSYSEFKEIFKDSTVVSENDFNKHNYLLIKVQYNSCSENNIELKNYKIENGKMTVKIEYEASCGVCAPEYLYYLVEVDKDIKDLDVEYNYKALNDPECDPDIAYKPMIYLYPTDDLDIEVKLGNPDLLTSTYPKYNNSWNVLATKDGLLTDKNTGRKYYGLYWEGKNHSAKVEEDGFIVKGSDTISFLEEKLSILGLNELEANEFIVYWLPKLEHNEYNYIRFETLEEIDDYMPLEINPKPDNIIRVLMDYKPLITPIDVNEQVLTSPNRSGFTVVEWGGSLIETK